jgi:tRNA pseudouridine38-40 synthase
MPRYRITIEYDGTPFVGWQEQAEGLSVQSVLQDAIFKFCGERVVVKGAGRTDSGVHALGQVAHFDLTKDWDPFRVQAALNYHVKPAPISILAAEVAHSEFDARFSATRRHYRYRILTRRAPPALDANRVWWLVHELDSEAMHEAAQGILGRHDFTTFRSAHCQASSALRTLDQLDVTRHGEEIWIETSARSFLHNQVRSMAGTLKLVGEGKMSVKGFRSALDSKDRAKCGMVAPPQALYLMRVDYGSQTAGLDTTAPEDDDD